MSPIRGPGFGEAGARLAVWEAVLREIEVVEEDGLAQREGRVHRADGGRGDDGPRPQLLERREVGPVGDHVRQEPVPAAMARDEAHPEASHPRHGHLGHPEPGLDPKLLRLLPREGVDPRPRDDADVYAFALPVHNLASIRSRGPGVNREAHTRTYCSRLYVGWSLRPFHSTEQSMGRPQCYTEPAGIWGSRCRWLGPNKRTVSCGSAFRSGSLTAGREEIRESRQKRRGGVV